MRVPSSFNMCHTFFGYFLFWIFFSPKSAMCSSHTLILNAKMCQSFFSMNASMCACARLCRNGCRQAMRNTSSDTIRWSLRSTTKWRKECETFNSVVCVCEHVSWLFLINLWMENWINIFALKQNWLTIYAMVVNWKRKTKWRQDTNMRICATSMKLSDTHQCVKRTAGKSRRKCENRFSFASYSSSVSFHCWNWCQQSVRNRVHFPHICISCRNLNRHLSL